MTHPAVDTSEPEDHELVHTVGRRELVCPVCGYGIVVGHEPERCPMCGSEQWEFAAWRPFTGTGMHSLRRTGLTH